MRGLNLVFILLVSFCFGQNLSFIYEAKYRLNSQTPEKSIKSIMILDFVNKNSLFREMIDKKSDSLKINNGSPMYTSGFENQFYIKKDNINNKIYKIITNERINYSIFIEEKLDWKIYPDKKKIGIYDSQKATLNYGGRDWVAWFTKEIPINDGPYVFSGLPGLIISIMDSNEDYKFDLIQIKKSANLFDARSKTVDIDWNQYKKLAKNYYQNPNAEIEQKVKNATNVIFQDANGNVTDLNIRQMNKEDQEYIKKNNNPIEINHKIDY